MLSGSVAIAALEAKHHACVRRYDSRPVSDGAVRAKCILEKVLRGAVPPSDTGSFDSVRLAPHCAQDDRGLEDRGPMESGRRAGAARQRPPDSDRTDESVCAYVFSAASHPP